MNEQIKEVVEEIERRKSDLVFLRSTEARIRKEVYGELLDWIKEAGYEWDEKAKKLVNSTLKEKEEIDSGFTKMMKKSEDKKMIENIISDLKGLKENETNEELISDYEREIEWLKEKI